eukprot:11697192-Alexandrium_andersonii.AAC.1
MFPEGAKHGYHGDLGDLPWRHIERKAQRRARMRTTHTDEDTHRDTHTKTRRRIPVSYTHLRAHETSAHL